MTFQQLLYFSEAAKELHFTRAAEKLYVSQSSLSHTIQALEAELGAPLFIRQRGKSVSLSKYGEIFLPFIDAALSSIEEGKQLVALAHSPLSGNINMGYNHLDGSILSTKLIEEYYLDEVNRSITFRRSVNHTGRAPFLELLNGTADVVIASARRDDNGLKSTPIATQELFAMFPRQHPLSDRESVTIKDIEDCQLSLCGEDADLIGHIANMFKSADCRMKNYKFYSDWATMVASISNGSAITISGSISFATDAIKSVPISHPDHLRWLYIVTNDNNEQSPHIKRFLDFCSEYSIANRTLTL